MYRIEFSPSQVKLCDLKEMTNDELYFQVAYVFPLAREREKKKNDPFFQ